MIKKFRHGLLNCNKKNDAVCQLVKEKKQKQFTKDLIFDIPFEEWIYQSKKNIYISDN
jgi:hypothetical protein